MASGWEGGEDGQRRVKQQRMAPTNTFAPRHREGGSAGGTTRGGWQPGGAGQHPSFRAAQAGRPGTGAAGASGGPQQQEGRPPLPGGDDGGGRPQQGGGWPQQGGGGGGWQPGPVPSSHLPAQSATAWQSSASVEQARRLGAQTAAAVKTAADSKWPAAAAGNGVMPRQAHNTAAAAATNGGAPRQAHNAAAVAAGHGDRTQRAIAAAVTVNGKWGAFVTGAAGGDDDGGKCGDEDYDCLEPAYVTAL